jgi:hypothetical protein
MSLSHCRHDALSMDKLLEDEKERNKYESWNKLEKMDKMIKITEFASVWCEKNNCSTECNVNELISYLQICLEKNKLKNKKDIIYDKCTMSIKSIPSLHYTNNAFFLHTDNKRISTLKSLTPKRILI